MTELLTIGASRARLLEIARQVHDAFGPLGPGEHTELVIDAQTNSTAATEVQITFSNDDAEPQDEGFAGDEVTVDLW
jgi:hypothetical protein